MSNILLCPALDQNQEFPDARIAKVTHSVVLDYSLFSSPLLDDVIAKERSRIDADRLVQPRKLSSTLGGSWANDASGSFVKDEAGKMQPGSNVAHLNIGGNRVFVLNKSANFSGMDPVTALLPLESRSLDDRAR